MQIRYLRATWGMTQPTLGDRLCKIRNDGFDGVETGIPVAPGERRELGRLLEELGLLLVAQQWTQGRTLREHIESFEEQYRRAAPLGPFLVNSHTGSDHLALAGNLEIFRGAASLEEELGVPVVHEVHRGRATFSTVSTVDLLDNLPGLKLAADFSHWCCVHESLLEDQDDRLERAIGRSFHIHARVGLPRARR